MVDVARDAVENANIAFKYLQQSVFRIPNGVSCRTNGLLHAEDSVTMNCTRGALCGVATCNTLRMATTKKSCGAGPGERLNEKLAM